VESLARSVLKVIGAVAGIGALAFIALFVRVLMDEHALDRESREFADHSALAILTGWKEQALVDRGSDQFKLATRSNAQIDRMFARWRRLGELEKYDGSTGKASIHLTPDAKAVVTASYVGKADFRHGSAEVRISLIQQDGEWRILGFGIYPVAATADSNVRPPDL